MSSNCCIPKTLLLIFSVFFHVEITVSLLSGVPNVTIPNAEYSGGYGGYVNLECIVDSTPNHTDVCWQKISNGTVENITLPRVNVYGATVTRPSLTFSRLNLNGEGEYTCFAVNIAGTGKSNPTNLTVLGGDIIVNSSITSYTEIYGSQVTLRCSVTYQTKNEPVRLFWNTFNSSGITASIYENDHITLTNYSAPIPDKEDFKMNHYFLTITTISFKDNGWYLCNFRDQVSWGYGQNIELEVIGGVPNVTIPNLEYNGVYGGYTTLECIVDSTPNYTDVYWQHISNGTVKNKTSSSPNVIYGATVSEPSLSIRQLTFNDEGQYICFAVNIVGTGESTPTSLAVLGGDLVVNSSITSYTEVYGSQVTLRCSVTYETKFGPVGVSWNKYNSSGISILVHPLYYGNEHVTIYNVSVVIPEKNGFVMDHHYLTITLLSFEDAAWYICWAHNNFSSERSPRIELTIIGDVPNVSIPNTEYSKGYGWFITLECIIDSTPNHTNVYWQHIYNGTVKNITSSSPNVFYGVTVSEPSLTIHEITFNDEGQYICFAVNIIGTGESKPTSLTILGGEILVNSSKMNYTEVYGSRLTLRCSVTYETKFEPLYLYWNKFNDSGFTVPVDPAFDHVTLSNYSVEIPESDGFKMNHYFLTLNPLSFDDDGWYRCSVIDQVSMGYGQAIVLKVIGGVPNVTIPNLNYASGHGYHLRLECIIESTPNHTDVYWQKLSNGTVTNITSSTPGFHGSTSSFPSLTVPTLSPDDAGQYTCFAVNIVGTGKSQPTTLKVLGKSLTLINCLENRIVGYIFVNSSKEYYAEVYGSKVTLRCSVTFETDFGPAIVTWYKYNNSGNGSPEYITLNGNDDITFNNYSVVIPEKDGFTMNHYSLTITTLSFKDNGRYVCEATDQFSVGFSHSIHLNIIGDIPYVHLEQGPFNATHGSNITLKCYITSVPTHFNVYWESVSNGFTTTWHQGKTQSESVALLDLDNASSSDTGQYICFAENLLGTGKSKPVNVTIYGDQNHPDVNIESNQYVVKYGSSLTITSSVRTTELNPVSDVYWQYNNNGVITKISEETDGINGSSIEIPSLTIWNVTSSESGTYTCYATNDIKTGKSRPINVIIIGGVPKVSVRKTNYTAGYGENVTMFCNITSDLIVTNVYWEKELNGTTIVINNLTTGIQGISIDAPSMTIVTTTTSDIGNYRCIATNDVGTGCSETTTLEVNGELPYISITSRLLSVKYGEKVHIVCVVTGNPPPTQVYWEKEFNDIKTVIHNGTIGTEGITPENPSLILLYATDSDEGLYKCFAVNEFGRDSSSSVELNVVGGRPVVDAPSITHITGIGYTVTLTCSIRNAFPAVSKVYWERSIRGAITRLSSVSIGIMGVTVDSPSLIIPSAMESMTGEYTCFAVNSVGTGSSFPATLTVKSEVTSEDDSDDEDDEEDNTHTLVNGIIGAVSALAGIGSVVVGYWAYTYSKKPSNSDTTDKHDINKVGPVVEASNSREKGSKKKTSTNCKQKV